MSEPITVEAVYENGVLRLLGPVPLKEHERVTVTVQPTQSWAERTYGIMKWTGDPEDLRRIAMDPEFDLGNEGLE